MSERNGGPVHVRSSLLEGSELRLWMSVSNGVLEFKMQNHDVYKVGVEQIEAIVLPELPFTFVISDKSDEQNKTSIFFCTLTDNKHRDEWLSFLKKKGVDVVNREGKPLQKRRVSFERENCARD